MTVELGKVLRLLIDKNASQLTCEVAAPPNLHLRGDARPLNLPPLTAEDTLRWMEGIAPESARRRYEESGECEFEYTFEETAKFLVTAFRYKGNCLFQLRRSRPS